MVYPSTGDFIDAMKRPITDIDAYQLNPSQVGACLYLEDRYPLLRQC